MTSNSRKWFYLITLSIIWGSSFILIKKGLIGLTPLQLGSLRLVLTGFLLIGFGFKTLKSIERSKWKWIIFSGYIASFTPAFLFAVAETEIDSAVVSVINSLVPLNTVLIGFAIFGIASSRRQIIGVITGFIGTAVLITASAKLNPNQNYFFAGFIILATLLYATNVNIIKKHLQNVQPLAIAAGNFAGIIVPATAVLLLSGIFKDEVMQNENFLSSVFYVLILSIFGTALAKVLFNKMVQISNPVFASSVTYLMPIVALIWGLLDGEKFGILQLIATVIILLGVYLANSDKKRPTQNGRPLD